MTDHYFIERIAELRANMRDRSQSLTNLVAEPEGKQYVNSLNSMGYIREDLALAEKEALDNHIIRTGVPLIRSAILAKYHYHKEIEINNPQFERAESLISHSRNLSCQVCYTSESSPGNEFIFNAKHLAPWKRLGIKKGEIIVVYAHHHKDNHQRAKIAIDNIFQLLGNEHSATNPQADYVHIEIELKDRHGLHARPSSFLVKLANKYPGEVFIKHKDSYIDAKSIMGVLTSGITGGEKIQIAYEPKKGDTSKIHEDIQKALGQSY